MSKYVSLGLSIRKALCLFISKTDLSVYLLGEGTISSGFLWLRKPFLLPYPMVYYIHNSYFKLQFDVYIYLRNWHHVDPWLHKNLMVNWGVTSWNCNHQIFVCFHSLIYLLICFFSHNHYKDHKYQLEDSKSNSSPM